MNICISTFIVCVLFTSLRLSGQQKPINLSRLPDSVYQQPDLFLQIQSEDIVLINSSSDTISVYTNAGYLWYDTYAIDGKNEWRKIDSRGEYCGTGFRYCTLSPRHYSWIKAWYQRLSAKDLSNPNGHATKIRICMNVQDGEQICSEPKEAMIERWRYLPSHLYVYEFNKRMLTNSAFNENIRTGPNMKVRLSCSSKNMDYR